MGGGGVDPPLYLFRIQAHDCRRCTCAAHGQPPSRRDLHVLRILNCTPSVLCTFLVCSVRCTRCTHSTQSAPLHTVLAQRSLFTRHSVPSAHDTRRARHAERSARCTGSSVHTSSRAPCTRNTSVRPQSNGPGSGALDASQKMPFCIAGPMVVLFGAFYRFLEDTRGPILGGQRHCPHAIGAQPFSETRLSAQYLE